MRDADLAKTLSDASKTYPKIRWMGVLLDEGYDGVAITGVLDGLSATRRALGETETTVQEAVAQVRDDLAEMWRRY